MGRTDPGGPSIRIVILTSQSRGLASLCLPLLAQQPDVEIAAVLYSEGRPLGPGTFWKRRIRKFRKIGILGSLNALRLRAWFEPSAAASLKIGPLAQVCRGLNLSLERTPAVNCERTLDHLRRTQADLGLSLGNPYIERPVFSIPRWGMVNVHHEILPEFQGARSILWQIYHGSSETGYTIHQMDSGLDTGPILYQERFPIQFKPTLRETVILNYALLYERSARGLLKVLNGYPEFSARARQQTGGPSFTTPTLRQYLRMVRQHERLYQEDHG